MSSTITRRVVPVFAVAAVAGVITASVVAGATGHHASPTRPTGEPSNAPSYLGRHDFGPSRPGRDLITATTSGGRVMVGS